MPNSLPRTSIAPVANPDGAGARTQVARAAHPARRAQPALVLLPRTRNWIENLPPAARPQALAAQFARIANLLCAVWGDPAVCREYFADLLTDRRGGRAGFPPEVLREIRLLDRYYEHLQRPVGDVLEWDATGLELAWTGSSAANWDFVA